MSETIIEGAVSIDRDGQGELLLARDHIVISDDGGNVVCLVPYYEDDVDARAQAEILAAVIVDRLNAAAGQAAVDPSVGVDLPKCARCGALYTSGESHAARCAAEPRYAVRPEGALAWAEYDSLELARIGLREARDLGLQRVLIHDRITDQVTR